MQTQIQTIDDYLKLYPAPVQRILQEFRQLVQTIVPEAEEAIRYGMPTFRLKDKNLLHFAAYRSHIGFYPTPPIIEAFTQELAQYKTSKGAIQFPLSGMMPWPLIKKMIKTCVKQFKQNSGY